MREGSVQKEVFPFGGVQAGDVLRLFLRGNFAGGKNDMKTEKRVLSLVLVFSMIASLFLTAVPVSAAGKTVDSGIWYGLEEKPESKADPSGAGGSVSVELGAADTLYLAAAYDWGFYDSGKISLKENQKEFSPSLSDPEKAVFHVGASELSSDKGTLTLTIPKGGADGRDVVWSIAYTVKAEGTLDGNAIASAGVQWENDFLSLDTREAATSAKAARSDYFTFDFQAAGQSEDFKEIENIRIELANPGEYPDLKISYAVDKTRWEETYTLNGRFVLENADTSMNGMYQVPVKIIYTCQGQTLVKDSENGEPFVVPLYVAAGDPVVLKNSAWFQIDQVQDFYESTPISIYAPGQTIQNVELVTDGSAGNWEIGSFSGNTFTVVNKPVEGSYYFDRTSIDVKITFAEAKDPVILPLFVHTEVSNSIAQAKVQYDNPLKTPNKNGYLETLVTLKEWNGSSDSLPEAGILVQKLHWNYQGTIHWRNNSIIQYVSGPYQATFNVQINASLDCTVGGTHFSFVDAEVILEGLQTTGGTFEEPVPEKEEISVEDVTEKALDINDLSTYERTMQIRNIPGALTKVEVTSVEGYGTGEYPLDTFTAGPLKQNGESWIMPLTLKNQKIELPYFNEFLVSLKLTYTDKNGKNQTYEIDTYFTFFCVPAQISITPLNSLSGDWRKGESVKLLMESTYPQGVEGMNVTDPFHMEFSGWEWNIIRGSEFYQDLKKQEIITIQLLGSYDPTMEYDGIYDLIANLVDFTPMVTNKDVLYTVPADHGNYNGDNFLVYSGQNFVEDGGDAVTVTLDRSSATIKTGKSTTITANVTGTDQTVAWSTDNSAVVKLTPNGNSVTVKGLKAGTATVTATVDGVSSSCKITVEKSTSGGGSSGGSTGGGSWNGGSTGTAMPNTGSGTGTNPDTGTNPGTSGNAQPQGCVSDTVGNFSVKGSYQYKLTSTNGQVPVVTVSNSNFRVVLASQNGNDYFFKVYAIGAVGQTCDVLVNGVKVSTITASEVYGGVSCDTTAPFSVKKGGSYQFKLTASSKPAMTAGSSSFRVEYAGNSGNDWFFKVYAVGNAGDGCGFYVNGAPFTVAVAHISE